MSKLDPMVRIRRVDVRKPFWIIAIVLVGAILIGSAWQAVAAPPPPIKDKVHSTRLLMAPPTSIPSVPMPGNLLANPSFEGDYVYWGGSTNAAPGWTPWSAPGNPPPCIAGQPGCYIPCPSNCENCKQDYGCWWAEAEHKPAGLEYPERVHTGEKAQQAFTYGRMGEFGVYQAVAVPVGAALRFSVYAQAWQCFRYPDNCAEPDKMNLRVGIGAQGETDPYSHTIVWSTPVESFDHYSLISVTAAAQNGVVTVWTYARPQWNWARDHNDAYWDDAALIVLPPSTDYSIRPAQPEVGQATTINVTSFYSHPNAVLTITNPLDVSVTPTGGVRSGSSPYTWTWRITPTVPGAHVLAFSSDNISVPVTTTLHVAEPFVEFSSIQPAQPELGQHTTIQVTTHAYHPNAALTITDSLSAAITLTDGIVSGDGPFVWTWHMTPTVPGTYTLAFSSDWLPTPVITTLRATAMVYMTAQPASAWLSQTVTVQVSAFYDYPSPTLTVTTPAGGNIPPSDNGITHTNDLYIHTWSFASDVTGPHHIAFSADLLQEPVTASVNIVSVAAVKVGDRTPPVGAPVTLYMWAYYPYTNVLLTINHPDGTLLLSISPTRTGGAPFMWPWTFTPTITGTYPLTFTAARLDAPVFGLIFAGGREIYLPIILKDN
jgi:hypothetical protein